MEKVLFSRRITVFIKGMVMCSYDNRVKLAGAFPSAMIAPNISFVAPQPIMNCSPIADGTSWIMIPNSSLPLENGIRVQFNPSRIDVQSNVMVTETDQETEVVNKLYNVLSKICEMFELDTFSRIAYAPVCGVVNSKDFVTSNYLNKVVNIPVLLGTGAKDRQANVSFRDKISFGGVPHDVNLVCNLSEGTKKDEKDKTQYPCLVIEVDINTLHNIDGKYSSDIFKEFLTVAIGINADTIDKLLKI